MNQWIQRPKSRQSKSKPNFRGRKANFPPELARLFGGARVRSAPGFLWRTRGRRTAADPLAEPIEVEIDHGRGVERQELRDQQSTHDRDAERAPELRARA